MTQLSVIEQLIKHRLPDKPVRSTVQTTVESVNDTEAITDLQGYFRSQATLVGTFDIGNSTVTYAEPQQVDEVVTSQPRPSILDQVRAQQIAVQPTVIATTTPVLSPRYGVPNTPHFSYSDVAPPVEDRTLRENVQVELVPVVPPTETQASEQEVVREVSRRSLFGGQLVL